MIHTVILASSSPQRSRLLSGLGVSFDVVPSSVDEDACAELDPRMRSRVLAERKAQDVHARHPDAWIIGCDTLVVSPQGDLLEKPRDADEAQSMIERQSGGVSIVHSGLCLLAPDGKEHADVSSSRVTFKKLSSDDITWWIGTRLWEGRSGAFQIDGPGQLLIEKLEGDWSSVVGLPVFLLGDLARRAGLILYP